MRPAVLGVVAMAMAFGAAPATAATWPPHDALNLFDQTAGGH